MKERFIISQLTVICIILFTCSCGTQKKVAAIRQQEQLEQAILQNNTATRSLDARYVAQTGSMRLNGQVKIMEDSCLWLSAQFFGMEAGRALLTDNSIQVIYRLQKLSFRQEGWSFLPTLRHCATAILLHRIFLPNGKEPTLSDFNTTMTEDGRWQLVSHGASGDISFFLDGQFQLTESQIDINGHHLTVSYSSFEDGFPTCMALTSNDNNLSVKLELSRILRNSTPDIIFNIPSGYSSAPIEQLLEMLHLK